MKTRTILLIVVFAGGTLLIAAIASCAGLFFLAFRTMDDAVSPTIDELFAAIDNGSFAGMYDTHTSSELQRAVTRQQFAELGLTIKTRLGSLKSKNLVQFHATQLNASSSADVVYNATFENGTGTIKARFSKEGDRWLLVSFQVNSPEFQKDLATGKCPHCGEPHASSARFCPKCGKPLAKDQSPAPSAADAANGRVIIYFDDISYTTGRSTDVERVRHKQEFTRVPYPDGGRRY